MVYGASPAPPAAPIGHEHNVPPERGQGRAEGEEPMLLALPLLLCLHALRLNEFVDVLDDRTLQHAEGIVCRRRRPQCRLGQTGCLYLAPVQARLHSLSLLEGDFWLDLQLDLVFLLLPFQLAANVVRVELGLELRQGHTLDEGGA